MKVFKFGGASIKDADGVRNMLSIVALQSGPLFVVVSAMGKTTNALEGVLEAFMSFDTQEAESRFSAVKGYHNAIISDLFGCSGEEMASIAALYGQVDDLLRADGPRDDYDRFYDRLVSYGEMFSSTIVSEYLNRQGYENRLVDMRECFVTSSRHREAEINLELSSTRLRGFVDSSCRLYVGQGFIGATSLGVPTTLGREGSDYSAAVTAVLLDAQSVTIWKDVPGVMNADPRRFEDAVHIPQLRYLDAIELAYSGASVIHPKTIKPLQNRQIPLYVRPFSDPTSQGSIVCEQIDKQIDIPIYIVKDNQVLISIRPKDYSFVLEERLTDIFAIFARYRQKINMIQSSAVNLSVSVDLSRHLDRVIDDLSVDFNVLYNKDLELLTIRGYDDSPSCRRNIESCGRLMLEQRTRRSRRLLYQKR